VLISALPVFADGVLVGARGVWRDVTADHAREAELVGLRRREHAIAQIVGAMRDEADVDAMLNQAAEALEQAVGAAFVAVATLEGDELALTASAGPAPDWLLPIATAHLGDGVARAVRDLVGEGVAMLMIATRSRGRVNGALCVGRAAADPWTDEDRAVVLGIADAVGLTIEQVRDHEAVRRLSRLDGLTGLLSRRAFREEIERRAALAARRGSACAVFYIDLDHFKQVNDGAGHAAGDAALVAVARLLTEVFRRADVVTRLGGDEFAAWCDDMGTEGARAKAEALHEASRALARLSPPGAPPLGLSIGVASRVGDGDIDALLAEADGALYAAKRGGRGRFVMAGDSPPEHHGGA
jgi:diguanylate cyclase (GGDEF)-like protein